MFPGIPANSQSIMSTGNVKSFSNTSLTFPQTCMAVGTFRSSVMILTAFFAVFISGSPVDRNGSSI